MSCTCCQDSVVLVSDGDDSLQGILEELAVLHQELIAAQRHGPTERSIRAKLKLDAALSALRQL